LLLVDSSGNRQVTRSFITNINDGLDKINNNLDFDIETQESGRNYDEHSWIDVKLMDVPQISKLLIFQNLFYANNIIDFSHISRSAEMVSTTAFDSDGNSNILAISPTTIFTATHQPHVRCLFQDDDSEVKLKWPRPGKGEQIQDMQSFGSAKRFLISTRKHLYLLTIYEAAPKMTTTYVVHRVTNQKMATMMGCDELSRVTVFNHFVILAFNSKEKYRPSYLTRLLLCGSKKPPSTTRLWVTTAMQKQNKKCSTGICSKTEYTLSDESIECLYAKTKSFMCHCVNVVINKIRTSMKNPRFSIIIQITNQFD